MNKVKTILLAACLILLLTACSKDKQDEANQCRTTSITMKVNGELLSFQATGRSAGMGVPLTVYAGRIVQSPYLEQSFSISLPYKETGDSLILNFNYHHYINSQSFNGDYNNGEISSKVITNKNTCIYLEFWGKISDGNQELIITEGKFSYTYEDPFDF